MARNMRYVYVAPCIGSWNSHFNGLVDGKIYRKPWFLPWNIELSCRFSLKPIQWPLKQMVDTMWILQGCNLEHDKPWIFGANLTGWGYDDVRGAWLCTDGSPPAWGTHSAGSWTEAMDITSGEISSRPHCSPEPWNHGFYKGNHPLLWAARFRLVKYYNLPR